VQSILNEKLKHVEAKSLKFNHPAKKLLSSPLRLSRLRGNTEVFWALLSRAESRDTYVTTAALVSLISFTIHWEQRRKITNKVNKNRVIYRPSLVTAPNFLLSLDLHKKYRISDFKNIRYKVLNTTAIASGYVGRDPQGGIVMQAF